VDLCPVGSLISKDFLHKARAWDLDKSASVCTGCSQGCNIMVDTRDEVVVRLRPRPNMDVNRHFMCDTGRMNYRWMNRGDRIEAPLVREGQRHTATDWDTALARLAQLVRGSSGHAVILASGSASLESLGMLKRLLGGLETVAAVRVPLGEEAPLAGIPNLALRKERAANADGARLIGISTNWDAAVKAAAGAALVVVLDTELTAAERSLVTGAAAVVVLGTIIDQELPEARLVLPITNVAEESGTFVNRDLRVQRYLQAKAAPAMSRPAWWVAAETEAILREGFGAPVSAAEAFALLAETVPALGGMSYADLGLTGRVASAEAGAARSAAGAGRS
jgi:NADH-quinone oxidoreductase subunit G